MPAVPETAGNLREVYMFTLINTVLLIVLLIVVCRKRNYVVLHDERSDRKDFRRK